MPSDDYWKKDLYINKLYFSAGSRPGPYQRHKFVAPARCQIFDGELAARRGKAKDLPLAADRQTR